MATEKGGCVLMEGYRKEILYMNSKRSNSGKFLSHLDLPFVFSLSIASHIGLIVKGVMVSCTSNDSKLECLLRVNCRVNIKIS